MRQLALILGAGGQLGETIAFRMSARHEVVGLTRADVDLADVAELRAAVTSICPDVIINCAAYTNVDGAEADPLAALTSNALAVRALARAACEIDATLVHFSTDFVFDGETDRPYVEDDLPNPQSVYASSKLLGEWFATDAPRHYILRVESLFGGLRPHSSVDRLLEGIRRGSEVRAFIDRTVSPAFVDDVITVTTALVSGDYPPGLYHCVNSGWTDWVTLAHDLAKLSGHPDASIAEVRMADANLVARRPRFAALSNAKLAQAGISIPTWQDALERYVAGASA